MRNQHGEKNGFSGKQHPEETRQKMSEAAKRIWEQRKKKKTDTGKTKIVIMLRNDVYSVLEEMCRREVRSKSREISWLIMQGAEIEKRIIRPHLSIWKREQVSSSL